MDDSQLLKMQKSFFNFDKFLSTSFYLYQQYRFLYNFKYDFDLVKSLVMELSYCPIEYLKTGDISSYFIDETDKDWLFSVEYTNCCNSNRLPLKLQAMFCKDGSKVCFSRIMASNESDSHNAFTNINDYTKKLEFYVKNGAESRYFSRTYKVKENSQLSFSDFLIDYKRLLIEEENDALINNHVLIYKKK